MNRRILRLAVPFIVRNITVSLVGSVDTALMGHLLAWECDAVLGLVFSLGYGLLFEQICRIYTDEETILRASVPFARWITAIPAAGSLAFILDGVYLDATATRGQRNITLFFAALFFAAYLPLRDFCGNHPLLMAQLLFFGARSLLLAARYKRAIFERYFARALQEECP